MSEFLVPVKLTVEMTLDLVVEADDDFTAVAKAEEKVKQGRTNLRWFPPDGGEPLECDAAE